MARPAAISPCHRKSPLNAARQQTGPHPTAKPPLPAKVPKKRPSSRTPMCWLNMSLTPPPIPSENWVDDDETSPTEARRVAPIEAPANGRTLLSGSYPTRNRREPRPPPVGRSRRGCRLPQVTDVVGGELALADLLLGVVGDDGGRDAAAGDPGLGDLVVVGLDVIEGELAVLDAFLDVLGS